MHNYTLPKEYLSASSIAMLLRCPKQYEFRYIDNLILPPNAALLTGTAMHKTLEFYYNTVLEAQDRERLTADEVAEYSETAFETAIEDARESGGGDIGVVDRDHALDSLSNISKVYIQNVGRYISPAAVEEEVNYESACGVQLKGYIDLRRNLVDEEGNLLDDDDPYGICDYKITSKKWSIGQLRNSLQFNLYAMMTGIADIEIHNMLKTGTVYKRLPDKGEVDGVSDISNNLRKLHHTFDDSCFGHLENLVESSARLITSGIFTPCNPEEWCCSPDWCGYWGLCRGAGSIEKIYSMAS